MGSGKPNSFKRQREGDKSEATGWLLVLSLVVRTNGDLRTTSKGPKGIVASSRRPEVKQTSVAVADEEFLMELAERRQKERDREEKKARKEERRQKKERKREKEKERLEGQSVEDRPQGETEPVEQKDSESTTGKAVAVEPETLDTPKLIEESAVDAEKIELEAQQKLQKKNKKEKKERKRERKERREARAARRERKEREKVPKQGPEASEGQGPSDVEAHRKEPEPGSLEAKALDARYVGHQFHCFTMVFTGTTVDVTSSCPLGFCSNISVWYFSSELGQVRPSCITMFQYVSLAILSH